MSAALCVIVVHAAESGDASDAIAESGDGSVDAIARRRDAYELERRCERVQLKQQRQCVTNRD